MFNLSRLIYGYEGKNSERLKNQFIFTVGIGGVHHFNTPARRNEWSGHFELQYSRFFSKKKDWSLDFKLHSILYQTNFDGKSGDSILRGMRITEWQWALLITLKNVIGTDVCHARTLYTSTT